MFVEFFRGFEESMFAAKNCKRIHAIMFSISRIVLQVGSVASQFVILDAVSRTVKSVAQRLLFSIWLGYSATVF